MKHKDQPLFDKKGKPRMPGQIGETKVTLIDKQYDWGIYVWKKSNGKWFTDGNGNILNIMESQTGSHIFLRVWEELLMKSTANK